jgi:putative copper resistance protein D
MIEYAVVAGRFIHYSATLLLFGLTLFPAYTFPVVGKRPLESTSQWLKQAAKWVAMAALVSALLMFAFVTANMTGTLSSLVDSSSVWSVLTDTSFGRVSMFRFALIIIILIVAAKSVRTPDWKLIWLSALFLATLAGVGHTQVEEGLSYAVHVVADVIHLLAASAWLGGLIPLGLVIWRSVHVHSTSATKEAEEAAIHFSGVGYVAVAALISSGIINSWFLVGSIDHLLNTIYGKLLLAKLLLFACMLLLAAANRFWIVPGVSAGASSGGGREMLHRLRQHVLAEQALGVMVLLVVSILGTMQPGTVQ